MNTNLGIALAMGGLAFSAQAAAQVTFFESESFQGRSFTTQKRINNFERFGFNDRASSVVVAGGRWEVCTDIRLDGDCVVLRPGRYPSLASLGLNDRVSSARAVGANARVAEDRYAPMPVTPQVTFYENEGFEGRSFTSGRPIANFQRFGFNDQASSVNVVGDRWEACEDANFRGRCVVLRPGQYPTLRAMGLNNRVSSVRAVSATERIDDSRYAPAAGSEPVAQRDYRRRGEERLYEVNVTSARAVVGTPEQRCWIEKEQVAQPQAGNIGAVIGSILGYQVGNGTSQDVQRCADVPSRTPTYWDVRYYFRGQEHRVQMTSQPGDTVTVNEQGEPRS